MGESMLYKILTIIVIIIVVAIVFAISYLVNSSTVVDNNIIPLLSLSEAKQIAENSDCVKEGQILETNLYNPNSKTYWFNIDSNRSNCNPACVVYEDKRTEINYRCTGLITDANE